MIVTAEEVTERLDHSHPEGAQKNLFVRGLVKTVVHAPCGAHPTTSHGAYGWDMAHLNTVYGETAGDAAAWAAYMERYRCQRRGRLSIRDSVGLMPSRPCRSPYSEEG